MKPKERVYRAIEHREADRVPMHIDMTPFIRDKLRRLTGYFGTDLSIYMGNDILESPFDPWGYYGGTCSEDGATYIDDWGITRVWISQPAGGSYTEVLVPPLAEANVHDLDNHAWPDFGHHPALSEVDEFVRRYGDDFFLISGCVSIFEASFNLIGYERFLMDLLINKPFVTRLVDILTELQVPAMVKQVELGLDAVLFGDDPSGQRGMLLAPDLWREIFRPRYEYIIQCARAANPDIVIANHNCGDCRAIIPDWIEIGMHIINPVQSKAMDPAELKRLYGDALCFWGGVDEQWVLPFGGSDDVVEEVKLRLRQLAPGGGYIIGSSHAIQADTSIENVMALVTAAKEFGRYPLSF